MGYARLSDGLILGDIAALPPVEGRDLCNQARRRPQNASKAVLNAAAGTSQQCDHDFKAIDVALNSPLHHTMLHNLRSLCWCTCTKRLLLLRLLERVRVSWRVSKQVSPARLDEHRL
jgi:hypothetical protein